MVILAAAAGSIIRVVVRPAARRELRERPRLLVGGTVGAALAATGLVLVVSVSPIAVPVLAGVAGMGLAWAWWHARPSFGRRKGFPPGSLSLHDSLDAIVDRAFLGRSFERYGPVFKMAQFHRPVVCVLGLERGRELLRRSGGHLTLPALPLSSAVPRGFLRYMAPSDYAVYAPLFRQALSGAVLVAAREEVSREARRACARIGAATGVKPAPADVIEDYVVTCLLRIFFGQMLCPDDRAVVDACSRGADHVGAVGRPTAGAVAALERFGDLIRSRAADPYGPPAVSLWSELLRGAPNAASDPTVLGNLFLLLEAARGSISGLLTWTARFLAEEPRWLDAVREGGGAAAGSPEPATVAVLETLRLAQSEYVYRSVEEPIEIEGFTIPAGWLLRICVAESHQLDPPFANPLQFEPERHLRTRFGPSDFAPFGLDAHGCLGARLTLELGRSFVEALAEYTPAIEEIGAPTRGNRHWSHWAVGSDFRLALARRR